MKISHEVPLCLLKDSLLFNDYQYALVHLLEEDEDYRNHFIQCKNENIPIYLDNSLHELGTAIGGDILIKWSEILKPECVFIPDVWQDTTQSIVNARKWSTIELPEEVTKVAVVQANNYTDAAVCYQTYKDLGYKKIAFSYGADYYSDISSHPNKNLAKALGRIQVISRLYQLDIINKKDRVHLLGCQVPQEFSWYKDMPFIETIDTSNPIMAALDGIKYTFNGLTEKPKANMNDNFYIDYEEINHELLKWNVLTFRNLLK
jgi:hypothetical protein